MANYFHVGDCFRDPVQAGGAPVTLVDCAQPHVGQVYAIFMLPNGPFPGNDSSAYRKQCGGAARALPKAQQLNEDPTLRTIFRFSDAHSWAIGDRSLTCILSSSTPRRGSDIDAG